MMGVGYLGKKAMKHDQFAEYNSTEHFYTKAVWAERFAWRPRRCDKSKRIVWLQKVMMGVAMYTGPGEPVIETRYHDCKEHLIWRLSHGIV
jgi:hypothetical protein